MTTPAHHLNGNHDAATDAPQPLWIGIDVSKKELQIGPRGILPGLPEKIAYDSTSLAKLTTAIRKQGSHCHVVFEATGGYERKLLKTLHVQGIRCSRVNPRKVRNFAGAHGKLAKTDRIDAAMIASFAASIKPAETPQEDPALDELAALISYRKHLLDELERERMQLEHAKPKVIVTAIKARVRSLTAQVKKFDALIAAHVAANAVLSEATKVLSAVKGVGALSAATLLAAMPELGTLDRKQAAALAGLAPFNCDSGQMKGKRRIYGGRRLVRQALYMAALTAAKHNEILAPTYREMIAKGKARKLALIAIMRRLLIYLNSLMAKLLKENLPNLEAVS